MTDQIFTVGTTAIAIMQKPAFALGVRDGRSGRAFHVDYERWNTNGQWDYERGRMWARLAPRDIPLKLGGKLNPEAFCHYTADII